MQQEKQGNIGFKDLDKVLTQTLSWRWNDIKKSQTGKSSVHISNQQCRVIMKYY